MNKIKLSPYAKIFYTEWLLNPASNRYNLSIDQTLYGPLDIDRLRSALIRYISEHVILNSHIQSINEEPYWVKNDSINKLECLDTAISASALFTYISRGFDLYNEPLYRFGVIKINTNTHRLIIVFHHILVDGSASLDHGVFDAISNYYNNTDYSEQLGINDQVKLISNLTDALSVRLTQNQYKNKEFWHQQLLNIEPIDLTFLKLEKNHIKQHAMELYNPKGEINFSYSDLELSRLNQIKLQYGITSYAYGQCIFALLLYRYTGQDCLAISYPIAIKEGLDFVYGTQLNTNLIPYQFNQSMTIIDLFNQNKDFFKSTICSDLKHSYYPITNIIQSGVKKELLNVCFNQAFFVEHPFKFSGITRTEISTELSIEGITKDILLFEHNIRDGKLNYRVRYNKDVINKELLVDFITSYQKLYSEILNDLSNKNSTKPIASYNILNIKQYQKIVYDFNKKNKNYYHNKTIHKLFEEQVLKTPNNIAIIHENNKLTYQELNNSANQLAYYLIKNYDIKPDGLIALCLDKNENILISILGVLKSGGAYVPIDPNYPDSRISYILEDANIKLMITHSKYQKQLKEINQNIAIICIDNNETKKTIAQEKIANPQITMSSNSLIYVIYTSGTTGKPKGVLLQHNNVARLFTATDNWYHFSPNDVWTLYHSCVFDVSVWEMWGALLYGGKLVIPTKEQIRDTNLFYELCHREKITILSQTPQVFYRFIDVATKQASYKRLSHLRCVIFAGEMLNFKLLENWFELYDDNRPKLINMYGITETTVHSTYKEIAKEDLNRGSYIGVAIPDLKLFVLDRNLMPLPIGAVGELYIGGAGLARGYLNHPELTKEKFINNPFQENDRLYKSGDLVRWLSNGELEYIGRNDFQVKIRGYRIELGEIENKLSSYPTVRQAVALVREYVVDGASNKFIIAYYVADKQLDQTKIHEYLVTQLPEYMLPRTLIYLDKLPLTINGKLDIKSLPAPIFENNCKYQAPENKQEKLICEKYTKILGLKKVGTNDDFFDLGGNSLLAITLTSALRNYFDINVADVFNFRTPKKLADNLYFGNDVIKRKLELIKLFYKNKQNNEHYIDKLIQNKTDCYNSSIKNIPIDYSLKKPINNVLLTGATGFLGCNILNQLLKLTNCNIFLLVRANSKEDVVERINKKFAFYFDKTITHLCGSRLFVMNGDLEKADLGLTQQEYQILINKIDSVIHAAALVKHYGDYNRFYSANVQATINLLEFTKLIKLKDFHYVSTISVLNSDDKEQLYTEDDLPDSLKKHSNVYIQTKLQGEQQAVKYRNYGVRSNIYRVGNMAFMAENNRIQENVDDNAFLSWLKYLLAIQCIAQDINLVEISQVDFTALAIVKLFNREQLSNNIYHVFNPNLFNVHNAIIKNSKLSSFKILTIEQFIDVIIYNLDNSSCHDLIIRFLLHQGWLNGSDIKSRINTNICQDKTRYILSQLNFKWPCVINEAFIKHLDSVSHTKRVNNDKESKNI